MLKYKELVEDFGEEIAYLFLKEEYNQLIRGLRNPILGNPADEIPFEKFEKEIKEFQHEELY